MMRLKYILVLVASVASCLAVSCDVQDCNRDGCNALDDPANPSEIEQGLAGVCAYLPDTSATYLGETCVECPFGRERILTWRTQAFVVSGGDASGICSASPSAILDCDVHFESYLEVGDYLACVSIGDNNDGMACVNFSVASGSVTTFNTASMGGMPEFYLSEPGADPIRVENPLLATCAFD